MFARSYGVLIFYALLGGIFQGVFWGTISPCLAEVVGVQESVLFVPPRFDVAEYEQTGISLGSLLDCRHSTFLVR